LICENVVPFVYLLLFVPQVKSYLVIGTSAVYANIDFAIKPGFKKTDHSYRCKNTNYRQYTREMSQFLKGMTGL